MTLKYGSNLGLLSGGAPGEEHYNAIVAQWRGFDALIQPIVSSFVVATPPASPSDGDCYLIPSGATGAWTGKTNQIARWTTDTAGANWEYFIPNIGWKVYSQDVGQDLRFTGTTWSPIDSGVSYAQGEIYATLPSELTITAQRSRYSKIGSRVLFDIHIEFDYGPSANGINVTLGNMPFVALSMSNYVANFIGGITSPVTSLDNSVNRRMLSGQNTIDLGNFGPVPGTSGSGKVRMSGTYETD